MEATKTVEDIVPQRTEQRIGRLTLVIGASAGCAVSLAYDWRWGTGLAIGAALAWMNFRWLKGGLDALQQVSVAQAGHAKPGVPLSTWVKFAGRYALMALCVYVIFVSFRIPVASMLAGLCALGVATMAASVYEVVHPTG